MPATAMTTPALGRVGRRSRLVVLCEVVTQAFYLNFLWLVGCVLVVTAPAATTALFASVHLWRKEREAPTAKHFFTNMRQTWRPSLSAGLVLAAATAVGVTDLTIIGRMGTQRWIALGALAVVAEAGALGSVFVFVVLGRGIEVRTRYAFREAARLAVAMPVRGLIAVGVVVAGVVIASIVPVSLLAIGVAVAATLDWLAGEASEHTSGGKHSRPLPEVTAGGGA